MSTEILTACPVCGEQYWVEKIFIGQEAECEECGTQFTVDEQSSTEETPDIVPLPYPGLTMVRLRAGSFWRGSDAGYLAEGPRHKVVLSYDFWIATFPVTQELYEHVTKENPSRFEGPRHPVERVSWHQAQEFCHMLTQSALAGGLIPEGFGFRLPTGAEWELACKGDEGPDWPETIGDHAWMRDNSERTTHPVGEKRPNRLGLCDMLGNVGEWCLDWYAPYGEGDAVDPKGPRTGEKRERRGGGYASSRARCRPADRLGVDPSHRSSRIGFRVVMAAR